MSRLADRAVCCGCAACAQICPKHCISMQEDREGFLYPEMDSALCVDCGRCEKVCPALESERQMAAPKAYAAKANDETIRLSSSSGGVFSLVAEKVLKEGGVVFGCRMNDSLEAEHICVSSLQELDVLRGSKYVQSRVGDSFAEAKGFLTGGRRVLFTGTPCQISGLRAYLGRDYENLLTVEVICHGAPSPAVWKKYVQDRFPGAQRVKFREKREGWRNYHLQVNENSECYRDNDYMRLFLDNATLRPSCHSCKSKSGRSGADITLGDFWGIENVMPDFDDDKGCSIVLVNTGKGEMALEGLDVEMAEVDMSSAVACNQAYSHSVRPHINRAYFFSVLDRSGSFSRAYARMYDESMLGRIRHKLFRIIGL